MDYSRQPEIVVSRPSSSKAALVRRMPPLGVKAVWWRHYWPTGNEEDRQLTTFTGVVTR
jgi:hypothetical protein